MIVATISKKVTGIERIPSEQQEERGNGVNRSNAIKPPFSLSRETANVCNWVENLHTVHSEIERRLFLQLRRVITPR